MITQSDTSKRASSIAALILVSAFSSPVLAQNRMPAIPADKMTPAQKEAVSEFEAARPNEVRGPYIPLLRSPELMKRVRNTSDYLRFQTPLPPRMIELIVLINARQWNQNYEWNSHYPLAMKAGLDPDIATAIAEGRRPAKMPPDETIIYDLVTELTQQRNVTDATYAKAVARFGEQQVIDAVSLCGHYTLISMVLNTVRFPLPEDAKPALKPLTK